MRGVRLLAVPLRTCEAQDDLSPFCPYRVHGILPLAQASTDLGEGSLDPYASDYHKDVGRAKSMAQQVDELEESYRGLARR